MLPFDIIFLLIDLVAQLGDHGLTLRNCSIVCREWSTIARTYIFRKITVRGTCGIEEFFDILKSSPHIGRFVLQVIYEQESLFTDGTMCPQFHDFIRSLSGTLPNLQTLSLNGVFRSQDGPLQPDLLKSFAALTSVTGLSITSSVTSPQYLITYISSFPNIRRLNVSWLESVTIDSTSTYLPISPSALTSVRLRSIDDLPRIFRYVISPNSAHSLRSLTLAVANGDSNHVSSFLREVGPRLEQLDLGLITYYDAGPITYRDALTIASCTNVKDVTLRPAYHRMIPLLVAQISSPRIERLQLSVPDFRVSDLSQYHDLAVSVGQIDSHSLRDVRLLYKREYKEMERAAPHLFDAFGALGKGKVLSIIHSSEVRRWWK